MKTLYLYLATCGIGRMRFRAWRAAEKIDRQDGDDNGTSDTPGAALRRVADELNLLAWAAATKGTNELGFDERKTIGALSRPSSGIGVREIVIEWQERCLWSARFETDHDPKEHRPRGIGDTPFEALREMADEIDAAAVHGGWDRV